MSGSLDNFPVLQGRLSEDYAPGTSRYDERSLADTVMLGLACGTPFTEIVRLYGKEWSEGMVPTYARECAATLGLRNASPEFDPSAFLQATIENAAQEMIPDSQPGLKGDSSQHVSVGFLGECNRFYDLLNLLIQTLYIEGYNGFTIDVTPAVAKMKQVAPAFGRHPFGWMGTHLLGDPENPLKLTCTGEFESFGEGARDCDLTLKGRVTNTSGGTRSTYDFLDCDVNWVDVSQDCVYYLDTFDPLREEWWCDDEPTHSTYHVRNGVMKEDIRMLRINQFWGPDFNLPLAKRVRNKLLRTPLDKEKYNTLLVPDSSGKWKEVRP